LRFRFGHILRNAQPLDLSRVRGVPESLETEKCRPDLMHRANPGTGVNDCIKCDCRPSPIRWRTARWRRKRTLPSEQGRHSCVERLLEEVGFELVWGLNRPVAPRHVIANIGRTDRY
jgi:hypothetical protein